MQHHTVQSRGSGQSFSDNSNPTWRNKIGLIASYSKDVVKSDNPIILLHHDPFPMILVLRIVCLLVDHPILIQSHESFVRTCSPW